MAVESQEGYCHRLKVLGPRSALPIYALTGLRLARQSFLRKKKEWGQGKNLLYYLNNLNIINASSKFNFFEAGVIMYLYKRLCIFMSIMSFISVYGADAGDENYEGHGREKRSFQADELPVQSLSSKVQKTVEVGNVFKPNSSDYCYDVSKLPAHTFNSMGLSGIYNDLTKRLSEQKRKMIDHDGPMPIEDLHRDVDIHRGSQSLIKMGPSKLNEQSEAVAAMLRWQRDCREYPKAFLSSPRDSTVTKLSTYLIGMIHHAKEDIKIACFHLTLYPVARALVERKNDGVTVELLTNEDQGSDKPGTVDGVNLMRKEGICIRCLQRSLQKPYPPSLHSKFFIFKNILGKQLVVTGSYNPTPNADANEWNDICISEGKAIYDQYITQFNKIKEHCLKIEQDFELTKKNNSISQSILGR